MFNESIRLCGARYEKPPKKKNSLDVAKKDVETYSSSNAAAPVPRKGKYYVVT